MDHNQIQTWPAHFCDEPTHAIWTYIQTKVKEQKLKIFSRGITLSKSHLTMTKFEYDLHNLMMYPYTIFELNVCNRLRDNERKPIYGMTKSNTTCICPRPVHGGGIKKNTFCQQSLLSFKLFTAFTLTCCFIFFFQMAK
jgi:hypothetical protein